MAAPLGRKAMTNCRPASRRDSCFVIRPLVSIRAPDSSEYPGERGTTTCTPSGDTTTRSPHRRCSAGCRDTRPIAARSHHHSVAYATARRSDTPTRAGIRSSGIRFERTFCFLFFTPDFLPALSEKRAGKKSWVKDETRVTATSNTSPLPTRRLACGTSAIRGISGR